jgi:hypothetical protein
MNEKKTRITVVTLPIPHEGNRQINWDDVVEFAMKCRAHAKPMQIRRRKKTRKVRAHNRELRELIAAQKADQNDRRVRFEHAIN